MLKYSIEIQKRNDCKSGEYPIVLRMKQYKRSTGLKTKIDHWNKRGQNVNKTHPKYYSYYPYLRELHLQIERTISENPDANPKTIWELLTKRNPDTLLSTFIERVITNLRKKGKYSLAGKYQTFLNNIIEAYEYNMPSVAGIDGVLVADFKEKLLQKGVKSGVNPRSR